MKMTVGSMDHAATGSRTSKQQLESIVTSHLPMVRSLARSVHAKVSRAVELDDLVQVGLAALIEASGIFVDRGEASFSTYATIRIRGAMIDETRKLATVSRRALRRRRELHALKSRLQGEMRRVPTVDELARTCGMSVQQFERSVDAQQGICFRSLDEVYSDSNPNFADPAPMADSQVESRLYADALATAITALPERQQMVLQLFFVEEMPLAEIGAMLGVGSARVCQIKSAAFEQLRGLLHGWA